MDIVSLLPQTWLWLDGTPVISRNHFGRVYRPQSNYVSWISLGSPWSPSLYGVVSSRLIYHYARSRLYIYIYITGYAFIMLGRSFVVFLWRFVYIDTYIYILEHNGGGIMRCLHFCVSELKKSLERFKINLLFPHYINASPHQLILLYRNHGASYSI